VPGAKLIGFPRGAGSNLKRYVEDLKIDAVGLDWMVIWFCARCNPAQRPVQGNLDPLALRAGGAALDRASMQFLAALAVGRLFSISATAFCRTRPDRSRRADAQSGVRNS
jgi:uroporphyrinogen decarboxylase